MRFYLSIIILGGVLVIGLWFLNNKPNKEQETQSPAPAESATQISNLEPQTNSEGVVNITVTPQDFSNREWNFTIVLDTHSEELTADLTKTAVLLDDKGNEYMPIAWEEGFLPAGRQAPGGHHRSGILRFNPVSPLSESITLKIFGVGGIQERNFTWLIQ
ncbi:MAG: hypothetical protein A3J30_04360 [Candidatus Wildermuthbacteria bacterium RIFCSPLOWO2_02_FULL_47_9c]|uniref:DUF4352 domain-containing protein n=2 Tax=Parcubacteria group TaxID=1794811 RepID=A0A837IPN1_9BACT|nr:MAG: hypothetical protein UY25_C0004G0109 [Candidatus Yanofskybacteria bacterium GW2011_GWC1_48_11]KKW04458.1 MAG: hypothetical protein UY38_C0001G0025 [Parcubacteria group bacterium GW2011_GWB1_49_12]KKW08612.1 MAG: hypothetical protein UY45_C0005G0015 [Parcubacteria group bacterium GW2011_GWA1_49_26]KKW13669.1 MAG: hypothetical protein UY53_C0009G0005 [Parcubacteria group bacterium GW2011_GWA2_50_10]OHA61590.1 MAG: hypothetical protein A2109_03625 [Candidatus Wildermuthbacteria bacterium G